MEKLRTNEMSGKETVRYFLERVSKDYKEYQTMKLTLHYNDARLVKGTASELLRTKSNDWRMDKFVRAITFYDCGNNTYSAEILIGEEKF